MPRRKIPQQNRDASARQVARARKRMKLSREELAALMGVTARTIKGWELGDRIPCQADMDKMSDLRP